MKALFIFNPYSGKAQVRTFLFEIIDTLTKAGYEVTTYPTQASKDATRMAYENANNYDLVVCSGGDGTLDEVVTGILRAGATTRLGYIPAGSTNDFASSLGISSYMPDAARIIAEGNEFACDIGKFNDSNFVYVAAFGIFTEVSYETPQEIKNVLGHAAYVLQGIKQIQNIQSYKLKVSYEDKVIEDDFIYGMITNSYSVGGFQLAPGKTTELNDGLFEVTLIKSPRNMIELNMILMALLNENIDTKYMYCFKTDKLTVESEAEVAWTFDGEYGGKHKFVEIENLKHAVNILIPKKDE